MEKEGFKKLGFVMWLIKNHGYTVKSSVRKLEKELKGEISFMTISSYLSSLCESGYVTIEHKNKRDRIYLISKDVINLMLSEK